jgi:hypothetical protein
MKTNDVTAESSFNTDTYLAAPTMTYGGNEEIVLKGPKGARKIQKSRKRRKKNSMHNVHQVFFARIQTSTEENMLLQLMLERI